MTPHIHVHVHVCYMTLHIHVHVCYTKTMTTCTYQYKSVVTVYGLTIICSDVQQLLDVHRAINSDLTVALDVHYLPTVKAKLIQ